MYIQIKAVSLVDFLFGIEIVVKEIDGLNKKKDPKLLYFIMKILSNLDTNLGVIFYYLL
jgi:uncharacterized membrane protein